MAYFNDYYRNAGLTQLATDGTRFDFLSAEADTYAEATSTFTLANKTGITVTVEDIPTVGGRRAVVPIITGATQTGAASTIATHWALTSPGNSRIIASGQLAASVTLLGTPNTIGTTGPTYINFPAAVDV